MELVGESGLYEVYAFNAKHYQSKQKYEAQISQEATCQLANIQNMTFEAECRELVVSRGPAKGLQLLGVVFCVQQFLDLLPADLKGKLKALERILHQCVQGLTCGLCPVRVTQVSLDVDLPQLSFDGELVAQIAHYVTDLTVDEALLFERTLFAGEAACGAGLDLCESFPLLHDCLKLLTSIFQEIHTGIVGLQWKESLADLCC